MSFWHGSWLLPQQVKRERETPRWKPQSFTAYSWTWQTIISTIIYWPHRLVQCGRALPSRVNTRRQRFLGPSWRLGTMSHRIPTSASKWHPTIYKIQLSTALKGKHLHRWKIRPKDGEAHRAGRPEVQMRMSPTQCPAQGKSLPLPGLSGPIWIVGGEPEDAEICEMLWSQASELWDGASWGLTCGLGVGNIIRRTSPCRGQCCPDWPGGSSLSLGFRAPRTTVLTSLSHMWPADQEPERWTKGPGGWGGDWKFIPVVCPGPSQSGWPSPLRGPAPLNPGLTAQGSPEGGWEKA